MRGIERQDTADCRIGFLRQRVGSTPHHPDIHDRNRYRRLGGDDDGGAPPR